MERDENEYLKALMRFYKNFDVDPGLTFVPLKKIPKNLVFGRENVLSKIRRPESLCECCALKLYDNAGVKKDEGHFFPRVNDDGEMEIVFHVQGSNPRHRKYEQRSMSMPDFQRVLQTRVLPNNMILAVPPTVTGGEYEIDSPFN